MRPSIRKRILLVLLLAQGLVTTAAAGAVVFYTHRQMLAAFDSELRRRMVTALAMVQTADEQPAQVEFSNQRNAIPNDDLFAVRDNHGDIIAASLQATNSLTSVFDAQQTLWFDASGRTYRGEVWHSVPVLDQDSEEVSQPTLRVDLAYAMPTDSFHAKFLGVVTMAIIGGCLWLTVSSLIAWFSISRGLAPLDELAAQASLITERSWAFRPASRVTTVAELQPLTEALKNLVSRLRSAFERERTFVNDAAHELKTAVAIQKSTLQVAANGPQDVVEYRRGFEQALLDVDRLETLVLRMLSLASVEGSTLAGSFHPTALDETLVAACDQLAPLAEVRGTTIDANNIVSSRVRGDAALLKTLWITLIENAIQHSARGSSIDVGMGACNMELWRVTIRDRGEGIAAEDLPRVFDRFYRADRSRSRATGGYGLGLAIAKAIVEQHNGRINMESTLGSGTIVRVELPRLSGATAEDF
jgi:signal transduction histidine kinase